MLVAGLPGHSVRVGVGVRLWVGVRVRRATSTLAIVTEETRLERRSSNGTTAAGGPVIYRAQRLGRGGGAVMGQHTNGRCGL